MKHKKTTSILFLFLFSLQSLISVTYFDFNNKEENENNNTSLKLSDVHVGNYTVPGVSVSIPQNQLIKIGLLNDFESIYGDHAWKGALLAAREINEVGGITINSTQYYVGLAAEDTDENNETLDVSKGVAAANRMITYNDPHFITGGQRPEAVEAYQEVIMNAQIPFLGTGVATDIFCQNVINDYDRYKYFFRVMPINSTGLGGSILYYLANLIVTLNATYDGWLKNVTILREDLDWAKTTRDAIYTYLPSLVSGFTSGQLTLNTITEYNISTSITDTEMAAIWDQVNTSGAQLAIPIISAANASIIMSKQYAAVKPQCLSWGINVPSQLDTYWDDTEGACQYEILMQGVHRTAKTPLTIPFWDSYIETYNIDPLYTAVGSYDAVRLLANVSSNIQSFNSDDIVTALENFNKTTPFIGISGKLAFWPSSHDLVAEYPYGYTLYTQWQLDGKKVVVPSYVPSIIYPGYYPISLATGSISLPHWGIHDLTEAQDLPGNFALSSDADFNDRDGTFNLTWTSSVGADNYSVFVFDENITYISKRFKVRSYEAATSQFTISGLKTGEYSCIVAAYNGTGETLSNSVYVKVERPRPGNFTLTSDNDTPVDTDGNFNLNWTIAEGADNYTLFTHDGLITQINGSVIGLVNQSAIFSFPITGRFTGDYFYAVMAYNETGETLSNNVHVKVRIPPEQFNLSSDAGTPDFNGAFNLTWSDSIRAENYTVYQYISYITEINASLIIIENQTILNSTEITGLPSGFYYYIITAYNGFNYTLSNCIKVNVRVPPGQFYLFSDAGTPDTNGAFNLTWSASISAENYTVYQYSSYITEINTSLIIIENQTILNSTEITDLPSGFYYYIITAYNGFNNTLSNCIKVEVQFYNEISGYWVLNPLSIDDMWTGDYTWGEAAALPWCSGSGTSVDPYIIEFLDINGQNSGSCLIIGNSNSYFEMRNCTFYNSGNNQHDAGLKLYSVTMGLLETLNCSSNSGNGIILDTCQDVIITQSTINDNERSGIVLNDCNNIEIIYNNDTINNNDLHGIYLENSNNNEIRGNTIHNNPDGIYLNISNDNTVQDNDFLNNGVNIVEDDSIGNIFDDVTPISPVSPIPFEIIFIIAIIGVAVVGSLSAALVIKKRKSRPKKAKIKKEELKFEEKREPIKTRVDRRREKEQLKVQKEERKIKAKEREIEEDLQKRISFVDYLIKENKTGIAIKNLLEIQEEARAKNLRDIGNKAEKRIELCKELESKLGKEGETIEGREKKIEIDIQKNLILAGNLIKENNFKMALKNLVEIQKEAQAHELLDLVSEVEEHIIKCKKLEIELINRIKQTILMLATKFARLQLIDICERSSIKDEGLIESVIQDMIKNKEIHGEYFSGSKSLALDVAAPQPIEKKAGLFNVFISYSTLDTDYFQISKLVRRLELYPEIKEVLFWEVDSKQNIVEFMEETLKKTNVFVLFCSEKSIKSEAVKGEWQSGYQMVKKGLMKMIPVYENEDNIPRLLWNMLNVKFTKDDFEGFIQKLYEEILR